MRGALVGWWELGCACSGETAGGPNKMGGGWRGGVPGEAGGHKGGGWAGPRKGPPFLDTPRDT